MSRNSQKLNKRPSHQGPEFTQQTQKDKMQSLFGLSFVVPTEEVELPTQGKYYPSSNPLHGKKSLEIKSMTAKEEDLLSSLTSENDENLFVKLIQGLLVDQTIDASTMNEEDKLAILLRARATGYGDTYETTAYCDNCKKNTGFSFSIRKSHVVPPEKEAEYDPEQDLYSLELPLSKVKVKLRTITDQDLISLEKEKEKKESLNIDFNMTISKISRMIVSANDVSERSTISQLCEVLPAADAKSILNFTTGIYPKLSTKQTVACQVCGTEQEREVPLSWAFFRTDI